MKAKISQMLFLIWLECHKLVCTIWLLRLPRDLNEKLEEWQSIDHRKDRSMSGKDFRHWLYLRMVWKYESNN